MGHLVLGWQGWGPPNAGPVFKTQSVGCALTQRGTLIFISVLHNGPGNYLKDNSFDNIGEAGLMLTF